MWDFFHIVQPLSWIAHSESQKSPTNPDFLNTSKTVKLGICITAAVYLQLTSRQRSNTHYISYTQARGCAAAMFLSTIKPGIVLYC